MFPLNESAWFFRDEDYQQKLLDDSYYQNNKEQHQARAQQIVRLPKH